MAIIEKQFDSVADGQQWLSSLELEQGQKVKITITENQSAAVKPKRKFSETALCGLWKDREDIDNVADYVRQLRKPRFISDVS